MVNWWDFDWSGIEQKWTIYCIKLNSHAWKRIKNDKIVTDNLDFFYMNQGISVEHLKEFGKMHRFSEKSMMKMFWSKFQDWKRVSEAKILNSSAFFTGIIVASPLKKSAFESRPDILSKFRSISYELSYEVLFQEFWQRRNVFILHEIFVEKFRLIWKSVIILQKMSKKDATVKIWKWL